MADKERQQAERPRSDGAGAEAPEGSENGGDAEGTERAERPAGDAEAGERAPRVVPIVGVGASAGGLEALQKLFGAMPADSGIAFVVVTHVQPHRESLLPELLAQVTDMPVVPSAEAIRLRPDQIVVAKDALLEVEGGVLHSAPPEAASNADRGRVSHPIDRLFRALAADQGERSICVVLSGSGNDGTLGLEAVKAAGGMVMVQDPDTAGAAGMPRSAEQTGLADYVLPPDKLPDALVAYCRGDYLLSAHRRQTLTIPANTVHSILVRLRSHTGRDFTRYKPSTISRRIERRLSVHHLAQPRDYLDYVEKHPAELDRLLQELLISVTSFFRDPDAWDALANIVPGLLADKPSDRSMRVWVPGCATGEEAYSIAIVLDEQSRLAGKPIDLQIFATDLDERAVDRARRGVFPCSIAADISAERLRRYFHRNGDAYQLQKKIRDSIVFAVQDVLSDPPFTRLDLIVCRNLLIYLRPEAQQHVLSLFSYALRTGGLLFLGPSESVGASENRFETLDSTHKIVRSVDGPQAVQHIFPTEPLLHARAGGHRGQARPSPEAAISLDATARSVEAALLDLFVPCSAVVDEQDRAIYFHGSAGAYFQPEEGEPRNHIVSMAREGLASELSAALREARRERKPASRQRVEVRSNGEKTSVDLSVRPLHVRTGKTGLLLVCLQASENPGTGSPPEPSGSESTPEAGANRDELERELRYTREHLQSTVEELETSNEELKSSNEELQSTNEELKSSNEELETSREELQSLNEELNTVNAELQSKVEALARANDDMTNLMNSMRLATIFLDTELRVKRHTEQARRHVRFIDADVGRPLSDLTSNLDYPDLIEDWERVLSSLVPVEKEIRDVKDRWYIVRIMPYRTNDNVIEGVVITVLDFDRAIRAEHRSREVQHGRDLFRDIVQAVREPFVVLDSELRIMVANQSFCYSFATGPGKVEGRHIFEVSDGQWDIPELRRLLETVLPDDRAIRDYRVVHESVRGGRRSFLLNARSIERQGNDRDPGLILLAFEEEGHAG